MTYTHVPVFDPDKRLLTERTRITRNAVTESQSLDLEVQPFASRNDLLNHIARCQKNQTPGIALVDLRGNDGDYAAIGARIIETIRRHPDLRQGCLPAAWTAYGSALVHELCVDAGSYGLITDSDFAYGWKPLTHFLELLAAQQMAPRGLGPLPTGMYARDVNGVSSEQAHEILRSEFRARFGLPPDDDRLQALFGLANGLSQELVATELAALHTKTHKTMRAKVDALAKVLRSVGGSDERDAAVKFLTEMVSPGLSTRYPELTVADLKVAIRAFESKQSRHDAYLDPAQTVMMEVFCAEYDSEARSESSRRKSRVDIQQRHGYSARDIFTAARQLIDSYRDGFGIAR